MSDALSSVQDRAEVRDLRSEIPNLGDTRVEAKAAVKPSEHRVAQRSQRQLCKPSAQVAGVQLRTKNDRYGPRPERARAKALGENYKLRSDSEAAWPAGKTALAIAPPNRGVLAALAAIRMAAP